jgi:nicotinamide-nucleotide amidase
MDTLAVQTGELLKKYKLTLGVVESATGGLISHFITNVPGSSDYYQGSITSYSNEIKMKIVGVKGETLEKYGAVSSQVAQEMAEGGRKALGVDICIADTGIAGPTGATPGKPVGLFYIGLATQAGTFNRKHIFKGTREQNKEQAANTALTWLKEYLLDLGPKAGQQLKLRTEQVVTSFLESNNRVLILRRSNKVGTYQGRWGGISGYIDKNADEQALIEIKEETGLSEQEVKIITKGEPLEVIDDKLKMKWIVHPFLFRVTNPDKVKTDWEHMEARWIAPEEIDSFTTVPKLKEALMAVLPNRFR